MNIKKVIVIGLDGLEPTIVEPMLAAGELPHLARLAARGGYARMATTSPAQTPVAWSTFATGVNPGGHGIFDFLTRNTKTYLPDLALNRYEQPNAFLPPKVVNLRRGVPVWATLSAAGIPSTVLRCPCTYPPDPVRGRLLSGLGTPDLRGGFGTSTFYTTNSDVKAGESEIVVPVRLDSDTIVTHLVGPRQPKGPGDYRTTLWVRVDRDRKRLTLRAEGTADAVEVAEGQWSDWLPVSFKTGLFQMARGLVRFHATQVDQPFALVASPIQFDPEAPLFPISTPTDYARDLTACVGPFATAGMIENHSGLTNRRFDEEAFLDQCLLTWREREAMMVHELSRFEEGLFFCLFDTPDRVQHMFWRFREPGHPALLGKAPQAFTDEIEEHYRIADAMVGHALEFADDETLLIALSDHGFNSFQRGFHLNTWLHDQGLLALKTGFTLGESAGDFLRHVDWSRTRAYALGLSGIYLNLQGREARGIVPPNDAEALKAGIARGLVGLRDSERNTVAIRRVLPREELYQGPYTAEAPDLAVYCAEGYRMSWASTLGGLPAGHFEDNIEPWSGDHLIDPAKVPGVLFLSRPFRLDGANLLDLCPHHSLCPGNRPRPRSGREAAVALKILVIGLDCAAPELLLGDERLVNLRRLLNAGCYGRLTTVIPPITVPAWMCMATSQDPGSLGVYGFRNRVDHSYDGLGIVNARSINELAIWDQIAREGKRSVIVGVPPNYPPRRVNGVSVGCFLTPDTSRDVYTHPASIGPDIQRLVGEYPVDVKGFRTHKKDWLRNEIYAMSRKHFEVVRHLMRTVDWDYFQFVEIGLDRMHHGFWKFHDPQHVLHEPGNPYQDVIRGYYRHLDDEIGGLLELLTDDTLVLVVSDHGAQRLDGGFCVNEWLVRERLLVLNEYPEQVTPFSKLSVNWAQTRAWSEGGYYARVFLNVKGREPQGTIDPGDYERVRDDLKARLEATTDAEGKPLGTLVFRPEEVYRQVRRVAPDLIVHFGGLYWRSIGGVGYSTLHVQENDTGPDDCNHAQQGAFVLASSNNPLQGELEGSHLLDIAPTLLELAGYDVPPSMQGRSMVVGQAAQSVAASGYTPSEEEEVRARLSGLGYIS